MQQYGNELFLASHPQDPFEASLVHETVTKMIKERKKEDVEEKEVGEKKENGMIKRS